MPRRTPALRVVDGEHPSLPHDDRPKRRKSGFGPSTGTFKRIAARDGFRCLVCHSTDELTIDHDIPLSRGGTNDDGNLQLLCGPCNSRKGSSTTAE